MKDSEHKLHSSKIGILKPLLPSNIIEYNPIDPAPIETRVGTGNCDHGVIVIIEYYS